MCMSNHIEIFQSYNTLVANDIYTRKSGASNILFIGGCRSFVYAIFFEELCKYDSWFNNAQFGIAAIAVHIIDLHKRDKTKNIKNVIENADIIICEQIRHYSFLNTSKNCEINLFNSFELKKNCKIIQIPNLELQYNIENNISDSIKNQNLSRFVEHCDKYSCNVISEYVIQNINKSSLFVTDNHPNSNLVLELFKRIIELTFDRQITDLNILNLLSKIIIFT